MNEAVKFEYLDPGKVKVQMRTTSGEVIEYVTTTKALVEMIDAAIAFVKADARERSSASTSP